MRTMARSTLAFMAALLCVLAPAKASAQNPRAFGLIDFADPHTRLPVEGRTATIHIDQHFLGSWNIRPVISSKSLPASDALLELHRYRSLAIVELRGDSLHILLQPRDAAALPAEQRLDAVHRALARSPENRGLTLIVHDPSGESFLSAMHLRDSRNLTKHLSVLTERRTYRIVAFDGIAILQMRPTEPGEPVGSLLATYVTQTGQFRRTINKPEDLTSNHVIAREYIEHTDDFFRRLASKGLVDDRLTVYEVGWRTRISPLLTSGKVTEDELKEIRSFNDNIALASSETTCTTYISGTRGTGADAFYAKPADAEQDRWTQTQGPTMVMVELRRGFYRFKLKRNGSDTGKTDSIDCNRPSQGVEVSEQ